MAAKLKVKAISAAVRVPETTADGVVKLAPGGGFDEAGKPILEPLMRIVFLDRGDELPDGVTDVEVERLQTIDAVASAEDVDAFVYQLANPAEAEQQAKEEAEARLALVRGETGPLDVANLAAATDQQLIAWITDDKPTIADVTKAVGDDATLASRVIAAENTATSGDPRAGLVADLEKVVEKGQAE